MEVVGSRMKYRNGKKVAVSKDDRDRDDDDLFAVEVAEGEQFMAVRPWKGQITEPDERKLHCIPIGVTNCARPRCKPRGT